MAGLGELEVRELPGPQGAATIVLIHGWTASADINFFTAYRLLGEHFRVIAFDQRGHGSGLRTRRGFRLEDCADDVARVASAMGIDSFVPVGYSMGGAIAQLTWQRHRDRVDGLVLAATAPHFAERRDERLSFLGLTGLAALARVTPGQARDRISDQVFLQRKTQSWGAWAVTQAARHDWRMVLEAGRALGGFSSLDWLGDIDVPTSVITTMRDPVVPLRRQVRLFEQIPGAEAFRVDGEHDAIVAKADRFVPTLVRAVDHVVGESRR
ncbi:MAG: alpha/beta hydrolase [Actinomycetota bacterium]|nr:alpha/beta hydrolase [Actinomycetota bacterium]MDA3014623.1 alpha/beta hydrolase [Actinomycetota bacterium]MDA3028304.1 alpha/beta hydrolase [Actinomycetota bacterium]